MILTECPKCGTALSTPKDTCPRCGIAEYLGNDWQTQARAAGWSKPVESRLRVVEDCPDRTYDGCNHRGCGTCHGTGTISRPLTQEEVVEVAEGLANYYRGLYEGGSPILWELKSGAHVILVEEDK